VLGDAGRPQSLRTATTLTLLAGLCLLGVPAASSEEDALGTFGEALDVVVVEVEAVVTDRDGRRVPGLAAEEFRLLVDGREVPIDFFTEVRDGRVATLAGDEPAPDGTDAAPAPGAPAATNYLVFIDEYFAIGKRRDHVVARIAERVRDLPEQDRMAVVAFDGEELRVLAGWDTSREELQAVLAGALGRPTHGLLRAAEWVRRGQAHPWHDAVVQYAELERVLSAVRSTLRALPRPEGRKVLLALGGAWTAQSSFSLWPQEDLVLRALPTGARVEGRVTVQSLLRPLIDSANLLGYTVYPLDVNGLRSPGGLAQEGDPAFAEELIRHGGHRRLGAETGGRALLFADRDRPLEAVIEDTRSYYILGFTPDLARDDAHHEIRVEVRGSGLEVRARTGYRDLSLAAELDLLAQSMLRFGGGPAVEAPGGAFAIALGDPQPRPRRMMAVPLRLDLPWREVTVLPRGELLVSRLEVRVAVRDRDGNLSEVAAVPLHLVRDEAPAPAAVLRWETDLTLRRERHDLVVSVYDALSGQVRTRTAVVEEP
jgi:VWFA-related protein